MNSKALFYIFVLVGIILFISCFMGYNCNSNNVQIQQENFIDMKDIGKDLYYYLNIVQDEIIKVYSEIMKRKENFTGYGPYANLYEGFDGNMGGNLTDEMKNLLKRAKEMKSKKSKIPKPIIPHEDKLFQQLPANNLLQKEVSNSYQDLSDEELKKEWDKLNKTKYQIDRILKEKEKIPVAVNKHLDNNKIGVGLNGGPPINTAESQIMYSKENINEVNNFKVDDNGKPHMSNKGAEPLLNLNGANGVPPYGMQCRFFSSEKCNSEYPNFSGASIGAEGEGGLTCNGTFGSKRATVIASITNGQIKNAFIVDAGKGYEDSPKIDVIGGGGKDAILKGIVDPKKGELVGVEIIEHGRGYYATPEILVDHPGKAGACYLCCK
jgi:hypothetical protein